MNTRIQNRQYYHSPLFTKGTNAFQHLLMNQFIPFTFILLFLLLLEILH